MTRDSVLTLLRELRRSLPSAGCSSAMELSLVADPDARWQTAAQFIFATQKQLLFFMPKDPEFLPLLVNFTLRPIMRMRRAVYYGHNSGGIHSFHRVAVQALEGILRLYGSQIITENAESKTWSLCDIVWESLVLYSVVSEQRRGDSVPELLDDLRRLIHTTASLACTLELSEMEGGAVPETMAVVGAMCAAFTKRATASMPFAIRRLLGTAASSLGSGGDGEEGEEEVAARPFSSAAKQLAIAAIAAVLDCVDRRLQPSSLLWHSSHPLTPVLADL
ncbi:hypothetical protein IWW38_006077, partial [Coemansia aciculifera]